MSDTLTEEIEGVAIIGMAGRFPKARGVDEFWRNLRDGVECISFFTEQELEAEGVEPSLLAAPGYVRAKGMLDDIELFDAAFFGVTPAEAESMDPQQRLFLESAWEALEHAGYDPGRYEGAVSVFAGVSLNSYLVLNLLSNPGFLDSVGILQASIRNRTDHLATRVCYKLNLKGAAVTVQTACSTSLVAVHLAARSLLNYECDVALAGGVTVGVPKKSGYLFQEGGIFSRDGHCRAFDADATGTVNGSGVGVVVLKRLSEALADGDHIHAVIRGSAINNDGSDKVGYTAPSVDGQADVIAMAQSLAGVRPETISYVETHGTGTSLGDPVEVAALAQVFGAGAGRKTCALGSVKTNIGHLDVAAGVAGLIKTVMALKHRELPPSLHFERPNPQIDFDSTPFYVNDRLRPWEAGDAPRRAGVSSFGIGGTNAHVVVEEAPEPARPGASRPSQLLLLSARTSAALEAATANLSAFFREHPEVNLADAAHTLRVGRKAFGHRRMVVCGSVEEAAQALEALDPRRIVTSVQEPKPRPVVFMFPGQGAQYVNMGRELYETEGVFREQVDLCAEHLKAHLGLDLRDVLYPSPERLAECEERLRQTALTQPALFVVEYALSQLLARWGVRPHAMIGHSIGEYVAACLASVFSLEEALALVAARGRVMQSAERGSMLMVQLPEREVLPLLGPQLSLASVNAPSMCVVAGPSPAVEGLAARLNEQGVLCRPLHTSHAFHSEMMEPVLDAFAAEVRRVKLNAPTLPFISNLTGTWVTAAEATDPGYWTRHLRQTVRFGDGLAELFKEPDSVLLEVGPSRTLLTIARWHPSKAAGQSVVSTLPHPEERDSDLAFLLHNLGRLWLLGVGVDWDEFCAGESRRRVPLPTYPFERQRYWIEGGRRGESGDGRQTPRRRANVADWFYVPSWKRSAPPAFAEARAAAADAGGSYVIFVDRHGVGDRVAEELTRAGLGVVTVKAGEELKDEGRGAFTINPRRREDYAGLLEALGRRGQRPAVIAHFWGVTRGDEAGDTAEHRAEILDTGFYSLLALTQALGEQGEAGPLQLNVVTDGMQQVTGDEVLSPEKATVLGPCKVIPQEYRHITCRSIDIAPPAAAGRGERKLIESLAAEFVAPSPDRIIAYRHGHRWTQTFEPHRLESGAREGERLRQEGVYLITGGMGGIGLVLAEHLARAARARLVLVGRTGLPERAVWPRWLAERGEQDATSRKIRKVQELEALGAQVWAAGADVSDFARMRQVVAEAQERFGPVNGVIHAAGVAGGGMIQLKIPDKAAAILAPKVQGARVLGDLFEGQGLDFMVLCSSRSAILGGFGQVDYCAANAFLDAFAHHHSSRTETFAVSVDWDGWREVGMLVDTAARYSDGARPLESAAEGGHPLLEKLVSRAEGQETYITRVSIDRLWILEEHRIAGTAVLPGVTYLEMARAAFQRHAGGRAAEIRDVFFIAPMSIKDNETRDVRFVLERSGEGFKFHASSKTSGDDGPNPHWQDHALGYVGPAAVPEPARRDIAELIRRCGDREAVVADEEKDPDLGPRWQNIQRVYVGKNEILVHFELDELFEPDFEEFKLHPSLLDRAAGTGMIYIEGIEGLYLPLSYKRLSVWRPLTRKIYAHIRYRDDEDPGGETVTFDVDIMDAEGLGLVGIEGFSEKRINDLTVRVKAMSEGRAPAVGVAAGGGGSPAGKSFYQESIEEGIAPQEGAEAFARILAAATLPQVVVSARDLHASIERANAFTQSRVSEEIEKLQASRPLHPRPALQTSYAAPRNEAERLLAEILQEMLGVEQVGVNDNYFELGGDSVLAIQIIARAGRAGLHLTPQQIFQHQTVADMAAVAKRTQPVEAEQGVVTGPVPLTPIQRWFFEEQEEAPGRVSQAVLLRAREALDPSLVEQAVRELTTHHDALRMRFTHDNAGWRQENAAAEESAAFRRVDVSALSEAERASLIRQTAGGLPSEFDLARGPLARFVYFDAGAGAPSHLLVAAHRLVIDDLSWRIILEDLEQACRRLRAGARPELPRKTTSFKRWAERLQEHAASDAVRAEAEFWTDARHAHAGRLPVDYPSGANTWASSRTVVASLDSGETRALQEEVPRTYHAQLSDVLLTALAQTLTRWGGGPLLFHSEGPGRETLLEGVELTRTVGWFAELFPTLLELKQDETPGRALKSVKEQLRRVPNWGTGYGLLRYLGDDAGVREKLRGFPRPEVFVSFRPSADHPAGAGSLFEVVPAHAAPGADARGTRGHLLEVKVFDAGGYLQSEWTYSENVHRRATVERLAGEFLDALRALIADAAQPDAEGFTPSDFPLAALNEEKLSHLRSLLADAED